VNFNVVVSHGYNADVQGSFYHAFGDVGVADNTVRGGVQQTHKAVARLSGQRGFVLSNGIQQQSQVLLFGFQFVFQDFPDRW
jgi:hypothetical protein